MSAGAAPAAGAAGTPGDLVDALVRMRLVRPGETPAMAPLTGGVSSDIWRVELADGPVCIKRALARLKVAAEWTAPVERNGYEYAWLALVGASFPDAVPRLLAQDAEGGLFAMAYLDPARHPVWKRELAEGRVDPAFAGEVGRTLAAIHAMTAGDTDVARRFATDASFHALRLEPYLEATARRHSDVADRLHALVHVTATTRRALVHGDVSPKNILVAPRGPVFLDAECAWYGDPAFDLSFCVNHMLLKCLWVPRCAPAYLESFARLVAAYLDGVRWEPRAAIEARAAALVPGLFLARVDGKSPVEYVTDERDRERVRRVAKALLRDPVGRLADVADAWRAEVAA